MGRCKNQDLALSHGHSLYSNHHSSIALGVCHDLSDFKSAEVDELALKVIFLGTLGL